MLSRKLIFLLIIKEQSVLAVKFKFTAQMNRNELDIKRPTTLQSLIDSFSGNQAPIEIVYKSCASGSVVNCKTSDLQKNKPEMTFSHLKREHVKYDMYEAV